MILSDINLLIYAYNKSSPHHEADRPWFESIVAGEELVLLPWHSILGFLRITTNPRSATHSFSIEEASAVVDDWLSQACIRIVQPGERHWEILRRLLLGGPFHGPMVSDAHLAALAIEHGAALATHDRGFARFPGLQMIFPLD